MKNRGYALSAIVYPLLLICLSLILSILFNLESKKTLLETIKNNINGEEVSTCPYKPGDVVATFDYTGEAKEFNTPCDGTYKIELWGASGNNYFNNYASNLATYGGYTKGNIKLSSKDNLYVYVGGMKQIFNCCIKQGSITGSGGATDVRLLSGTWNDVSSLRSRIMVAGGAGGSYVDSSAPGGGAAGGLDSYTVSHSSHPVYSSTQIAGGKPGYNGTAGGFGYGGTNTTAGYNSGAGGYYGGGSGPAGGGGSSFISGHTGCVAISSKDSNTPKAGCTSGTTTASCSYHYSNYIFTDTVMIDGKGYQWTNVKGTTVVKQPTHDGKGTQIGNDGNGYAKITLVSY